MSHATSSFVDESDSTRWLTPITRAMTMIEYEELYRAVKFADVYRVQAEENRATHCCEVASHTIVGCASPASGRIEYELGLGL